eukprot:Phypoly_transcript_12256.p1 GENE.Phypoly_transcript_12256~~Phypoly_transcript_12256.p1  ORF type:complete len:244 (+),score=30.36 Phypoly_transcript_12256:321-1052(+)
MTKVSRTHQHAYRQHRFNPIFCTTSEIEMPHLIKEYLHNARDDPITTRTHSRPSVELNANLEQILRTYLSQFWRHEVEKVQGGCTLWDEITGFTPRLYRRHHPNSISAAHSLSQPPPDSQWWWQPSFAQDDLPTPTNSQYNHPPATLSVSALSPNLSSPSTPSSSSDTSPGASPYTGSPEDAIHVKTRWQVFAERLFSLLLRIPHFSLNIHMQRLIRVHQEANVRKDTELADIIKNYLATVLQ